MKHAFKKQGLVLQLSTPELTLALVKEKSELKRMLHVDTDWDRCRKLVQVQGGTARNVGAH